MNRIDFFIEYIKWPSILMLGFFLGVGFILLSAADALISHEIVKTRRDAINLMGYPKKKESKLIEKETIKDFLIGVVVLGLILVPEILKMLISILYLGVVYFIFTLDTSTFDKTQALAALIILIICPIGSYYFYEKTWAKVLYDELVKWLSKHTSIITSERRIPE